MPKQLTISDHALMRYIERVLGVDLEGVREQIKGKKLLKEAAALGSTAMTIEGFVYLMEKGNLITITSIDDRRCGHNKGYTFKDGYQQQKGAR